MSDPKITINRTLVGFLTLVCWAAALVILLFAPRGEDGGLRDVWPLWLGGFVRVGLLMWAFWLALPTRHRKAAWANVSPTTFIGLIVAMIATVRLQLKIVLPIFIAVTIIGFVLRPRDKRRPRAGPNGSS